jgi:hypothetical protein
MRLKTKYTFYPENGGNILLRKIKKESFQEKMGTENFKAVQN